MTREVLRSKYEELKFNDFAMIEWIMSQDQHTQDERKEAFKTLTTFPEYGEPRQQTTTVSR